MYLSLVLLAFAWAALVAAAVSYRRAVRSELPSEAFHRLYRPPVRPRADFDYGPGSVWAVSSSCAMGPIVTLQRSGSESLRFVGA